MFSKTTYVVYGALKSPQPRSEIRRLRAANFADIIETVTVFIKKNFKDSKKVKRIRNFVLKSNLYQYFFI